MYRFKEFKPDYIIEHGKEIINFFCLEYNINPNNRFSIFIKNYEKMCQDKDLPVFNSDRHISLLAGFKDFIELELIYSSGVYKDAPLYEIKRLFNGNIRHFTDTNQTPRDIQFQFSIVALLKNNGFTVKMCEPDFFFHYDKTDYPVAAKRVSSPKQIEKRIKEAEKQISKFDISGIIALSIENLFKPEDQIISDKPFSQSSKELEKRLRNYSKKYFYGKYFEERKHVSAFFLNSSLPVCFKNSVYFGYVNSLLVVPVVPEDSFEFQKFKILAECL
jgi:hypothetical protein